MFFEGEHGRPTIGADADPAVFATDEDTRRHIIERSRAGSPLHVRALAAAG